MCVRCTYTTHTHMHISHLPSTSKAYLIKWTASVSQLLILPPKTAYADAPQCPLMFTHTPSAVDSPLRLHNHWLKTCRWFSTLGKTDSFFFACEINPKSVQQLVPEQDEWRWKAQHFIKGAGWVYRSTSPEATWGGKKACVLYFRGKVSTPQQATVLLLLPRKETVQS